MSRIFAYCRASVAGETNNNQILQIQNSGFNVETHRIIEEQISGSVCAKLRPRFQILMHKLERGDVLVVTNIDRLGRNAMDVRETVEKFTEIGVRVHCLALGGIDLTSSSGRMTMQVIAAMAEFERDLIIERTKIGLQRAKAQGKKLGRPPRFTAQDKIDIKQKIEDGVSMYRLSKDYDVSRQSILRIKRQDV